MTAGMGRGRSWAGLTPCVPLGHVKRPTLALVVKGNQPDEISRNALISRLCVHFALGPFSIGFPMSFPRSLRPERAIGPLTAAAATPGPERQDSGTALPAIAPKAAAAPTLPFEHQPLLHRKEPGREQGGQGPPPPVLAGLSPQSGHLLTFQGRGQLSPPRTRAPVLWELHVLGATLTPQGSHGAFYPQAQRALASNKAGG